MDLLYRGINQISFLNILIDNSGNMDLNVLRRKIASICRKHSIKCIYIAVTQRRTELLEISRTLKNIAKDFEVPVVALSQISRRVEKTKDRN